MCVGRGDKWLLEKRATDGAVCPPGGKIESRQSMYELERNAVGTQVTVYTETALQAVLPVPVPGSELVSWAALLRRRALSSALLTPGILPGP